MSPEKRRPRVLITRLSHVGDCIATIPVLNALRGYYPLAFIAWATERPMDQLLADHPALDELILVPKGWMKSPAAVWKMRQKLKPLRFDIVIDPQGLTKTAALGWMSGARTRIGFTRGLARELAPLLNNQRIKPAHNHIVDHSLELLRPLGIRDPQVEFHLPESAEARRNINRFIQNSHLGCGYAVINHGAGWPSRRWSADRFGSVAKRLGERHKLPTVVVWAGGLERETAVQIVERSGGHALMGPPTNLAELAVLLRDSRMYVGCDTGPMHLAVALDKDCVVLHGPTLPAISGAYGPNHIAVQQYYQIGTSRQRRRATNDAMLAIGVDDVCAACDRILERQHQRHEAA